VKPELCPLFVLAKLAAHEQQFLARWQYNELGGADVGEPLPLVAGHLVNQGSLAMTTSSWERQQEILWKAYNMLNVMSLWWKRRNSGSVAK